MSKRRSTTTGTKVATLAILLITALMILNIDDRDHHSDDQQVNTQHAVVMEPTVPQSTEQSNSAAKQPADPPTTEQPKWVRPKIYPGVKLYYSHDRTKMRYIGTIFDAVGCMIDGERCFGITMASGTQEYRKREILWNGHWFMDRVQSQEAIDEFLWESIR